MGSTAAYLIGVDDLWFGGWGWRPVGLRLLYGLEEALDLLSWCGQGRWCGLLARLVHVVRLGWLVCDLRPGLHQLPGFQQGLGL